VDSTASPPSAGFSPDSVLVCEPRSEFGRRSPDEVLDFPFVFESAADFDARELSDESVDAPWSFRMVDPRPESDVGWDDFRLLGRRADLPDREGPSVCPASRSFEVSLS